METPTELWFLSYQKEMSNKGVWVSNIMRETVLGRVEVIYHYECPRGTRPLSDLQAEAEESFKLVKSEAAKRHKENMGKKSSDEHNYLVERVKKIDSLIEAARSCGNNGKDVS